MIAVDTNMLIYAHRGDMPQFEQAYAQIARLAESGRAWGIPVACVHEFLSVVTNHKIFADQKSSCEEALDQIQSWLESPTAHLLHTGAKHFEILADLVQRAQVSGGQMHDARIAAICIENGVTEFWSCDRDFGKFPQLKTRNPLVS